LDLSRIYQIILDELEKAHRIMNVQRVGSQGTGLLNG